MLNMRTFIVKYLGYTDKKPDRISITDLRYKKTKIIYPSQYNSRDMSDMASQYLNSIGIKIDSQSEGNGYMMLHTSDFKTQIKD